MTKGTKHEAYPSNTHPSTCVFGCVLTHTTKRSSLSLRNIRIRSWISSIAPITKGFKFWSKQNFISSLWINRCDKKGIPSNKKCFLKSPERTRMEKLTFRSHVAVTKNLIERKRLLTKQEN